MSRFASAVVIALLASVPASADPPADQTVLDTVEKSLEYIQTAGVEWIEQRECVSCHQVPFMVWSLNRAADHGLPVDADKLQTWNQWARDWQNFAAPKNRGDLKEADELSGNVDILYQLLLARRPAEQSTDWTETFLTTLASAQQADGSWSAGGQLPFQKRPKPETHAVTTMWTLYTLAAERPAEVWEPLQQAAEPILQSADPPVSTEWWAVRLLLSHQLGHAELAEQARRTLLQHQREDGGWGWLLAEDSDALGTGIALYALSRTGVSNDEAAISRGRQFLISTQREDGSWPVRGTKAARRDRIEETATYWGTCWAVIGLLETLETPDS